MTSSQPPPPAEPFRLLLLKEITDLQRKVSNKKKKITVDLIGTKYDVIKEVVSKTLGWQIYTSNEDKVDDWNLMWYDTYISEDDLRRMLPYQKINHYPGSQQLGRKNNLAKNLSKLRNVFPNDFNFYP